MPSLQRESICNACGYWLTQLMWYFLRGYHDNSSSILSPMRRYVASVNNIFKPREPSSTAIQFSSRFDYNPIIGKRASIPQNGHVLRAPICNCQLCLRLLWRCDAVAPFTVGFNLEAEVHIRQSSASEYYTYRHGFLCPFGKSLPLLFRR